MKRKILLYLLGGLFALPLLLMFGHVVAVDYVGNARSSYETAKKNYLKNNPGKKDSDYESRESYLDHYIKSKKEERASDIAQGYDSTDIDEEIAALEEAKTKGGTDGNSGGEEGGPDNNCDPNDYECQKQNGYPSTETKDDEKDKEEDQGCGEVPEGQYCCDGIVANVPCDSVVVTPEKKCKGIKLNTNFPIVGNCITTGETDATRAFPTMIGALTKIAMALVFVVCFIMIIVAGIMWAGAGEDAGQAKKAKDLIFKVGIAILLLGFSGVILRLINPNFFG